VRAHEANGIAGTTSRVSINPRHFKIITLV
jgi:hypothetical protein